MKKLVIWLIVVSIALAVCFIIKNNSNKEQIDYSKWYIEISNEYINIRQEPNAFSEKLGQVKKNEVYEVYEINLEDSKYYWYKIKKGWVASPRKNNYVIDNNNPYDIAKPTLKFQDDTYYVHSIEDINYKHLEAWDDKEYKLSHEVYYEADKDQYWITYTITDGADNKVSKTQKIIFEVKPENVKGFIK